MESRKRQCADIDHQDHSGKRESLGRSSPRRREALSGPSAERALNDGPSCQSVTWYSHLAAPALQP